MELGTATAFTPWASLLGGMLIGLSAVILMGTLGRIAGISGITSGGLARVLPAVSAGAGAEWSWRLAFIGGLVTAPLLVQLLTGAPIPQEVPGNLWAMLAAGLLVGLGTALGSGCTSGHGVCGLARLSPRSLAAVASFMGSAALTVFVLRHLL